MFRQVNQNDDAAKIAKRSTEGHPVVHLES